MFSSRDKSVDVRRSGGGLRRPSLAALVAVVALALMGGLTEDANADVRMFDGTNVTFDVNCYVDWSGRFVKYTTSSTTPGVWYRVFTRAYDSNWRFVTSGTTGWYEMSHGRHILGAAQMGTVTSPIRNYVFEVQFFKSGVYTQWFATAPTTTAQLNANGGYTSTAGCRL
jgi:hypothetical protein